MLAYRGVEARRVHGGNGKDRTGFFRFSVSERSGGNAGDVPGADSSGYPIEGDIDGQLEEDQYGMLMAEPFLFRPWEIERLTDKQIEVMLKGQTKMMAAAKDEPADSEIGEPEEITPWAGGKRKRLQVSESERCEIGKDGFVSREEAAGMPSSSADIDPRLCTRCHNRRNRVERSQLCREFLTVLQCNRRGDRLHERRNIKVSNLSRLIEDEVNRHGRANGKRIDRRRRGEVDESFDVDDCVRDIVRNELAFDHAVRIESRFEIRRFDFANFPTDGPLRQPGNGHIGTGSDLPSGTR
jgi:hypothetical protein